MCEELGSGLTGARSLWRASEALQSIPPVINILGLPGVITVDEDFEYLQGR